MVDCCFEKNKRDIQEPVFHIFEGVVHHVGCRLAAGDWRAYAGWVWSATAATGQCRVRWFLNWCSLACFAPLPFVLETSSTRSFKGGGGFVDNAPPGVAVSSRSDHNKVKREVLTFWALALRHSLWRRYNLLFNISQEISEMWLVESITISAW